MQFRIADTFTDSMAKLTAQEQRAVKTTAFDLQINPAQPGHNFHRVDRARDSNFWSVRVNRDIRIIVHRNDSSLLLCYVDHHDKAYDWAERRKLQVHPKTGAAQLVKVRETVKEIVVPVYKEAAVAPEERSALLEHLADDDLLAYGVPQEWLADVKAADESVLLEIADHLPAEAAEAVLDLATGTTPEIRVPASPDSDPFEHPDAQRRFRVFDDVEELERALEFPWETWAIFLHPAQRDVVEKDFNGPARVSGSAGTGKTIVALHRAAHLARSNEEARVLLTTFSKSLADSLKTKLRRLIHNEPRLGERIDIYSISEVVDRLSRRILGDNSIAEPKAVYDALSEAASTVPDHRFGNRFLVEEWEQVVDAWKLEDWEEYREVARLGRKTRLPESRREVLWSIYERLREIMNERGLVTEAGRYHQLVELFEGGRASPYDFIVMDEAQDVSVPQLRLVAAMGGNRPNSLFFAGDLGQRIFQQPFSWKSLGVDIRGRSRMLKVNYRTSHQIRMQADRLLGPEITDVDGNAENRTGTVSVFNGPPAVILKIETEQAEIEVVADQLRSWTEENGVAPNEVGVFVRSGAQLKRAVSVVERAGLGVLVLDEFASPGKGKVTVSTMHLAKGLEFRAVVVMACDDEVLPLQERIESVTDQSDLAEVYETERHLLYVACTRARDHLLVSGVEPASEYLDDLIS